MSDLHNIDKLLKESLTDFAPDAPNVWQGIEQGVKAAQASQAGTIATATKATSFAVKIGSIVLIGATAVTGFVLLKDKTEPVQANNQPAMSVTENVPESEASTLPAAAVSESNNKNNHNKPEFISTPRVNTQATQNITPTILPTPEVLKEEEPQPIVNTEDTKQPKSEQQPSQTKAEVKVSAPKQEFVPPVKNNNTTGKMEAQPTPKPYNPNAEGEEEFDKPTIPGSISPNGDGLNDRFKILIENEIMYALVIYDKYGNIVFESNDKAQEWDGRDYKSGVLCESGTYQYVFRYQFKGSQVERKKTGAIRLFNN